MVNAIHTHVENKWFPFTAHSYFHLPKEYMLVAIKFLANFLQPVGVQLLQGEEDVCSQWHVYPTCVGVSLPEV